MRLANDTQRHAIYGMTGSGKTIAGLWALEQRSWTRRPWVIMDFKGDDHIAEIPRLEEIDITGRVPKHAGLYVVRPLPHEKTEPFLWSMWERGHCGLFVDEAYMLNRFNKAWNAILTQGRSIQVPVIELTQRPTWLSPFAMSEADFHQVMDLQMPADIAKLEQWVPGLKPTRRDYSSQYYDVERRELAHLGPVPGEAEIMERFERAMPRRRSPFFTNARPAYGR